MSGGTGEERTVRVTLGDLPAQFADAGMEGAATTETDVATELGFTVRDLTPQIRRSMDP